MRADLSISAIIASGILLELRGPEVAFTHPLPTTGKLFNSKRLRATRAALTTTAIGGQMQVVYS
ncbi:hypothetical protein FHS00_003340 [Limimaricola variabilis]|uniref:Uncharacterized protein n=1 Tax=Limimaricola variabilis TaxID=1492771 RepID=A0ABR6HT44_9RHOB|nr:hypothetical protein [Limimaricola variabilis]